MDSAAPLVSAPGTQGIELEKRVSALHPRVRSTGTDAGGSTALNDAAAPAVTASAVEEEHVRKVLRMIESESAHTVNDLALKVNLSPSRLQHLFKQQTGVCVGQVLAEQRLQRAAHLLANSNLRIKEIAYTVGYEHTSSFIRAFERRFAQAPRCYRFKNSGTEC